MGRFAETAIVDYRLSFANQGKQPPFSVCVCCKQTEVCPFHFKQTNGSLPFPFAANKRKLAVTVFRLLFPIFPFEETWRRGDIEAWRHGDMEMGTWKHGDMET